MDGHWSINVQSGSFARKWVWNIIIDITEWPVFEQHYFLGLRWHYYLYMSMDGVLWSSNIFHSKRSTNKMAGAIE